MKVLKRRFIPRKRTLDFTPMQRGVSMHITCRQWWIWDNLLKIWVSMAKNQTDCNARARKLNAIHLRVVAKLAA